MDDPDDRRPAGPSDELDSIRCSACAAALDSPGRDSVSFLLVDQLTLPLVGCPDHLRLFGDVCGLTTTDAADLLQHRPAGGVRCPSCRHATRRPHHPVVPVADGAVAILGCSQHTDDIVDRYRAGLRTRERITASLPQE